MSKQGRKQVKPQGLNAQLRESIKRLEGRMKGLETALGEHDGRLQKLEVVQVLSPTTTEPAPEPDYPQRPETE